MLYGQEDVSQPPEVQPQPLLDLAVILCAMLREGFLDHLPDGVMRRVVVRVI